MKKISKLAVVFVALAMFSSKIQAQQNFAFDGADVSITLNNDKTQIIAAEFSVNNEIFPFEMVNNENQVSSEGDGIVYTAADPAGNIFVMEYTRTQNTLKVMNPQTSEEIILNFPQDGPVIIPPSQDGPVIVPPSYEEPRGQNAVLSHARKRI